MPKGVPGPTMPSVFMRRALVATGILCVGLTACAAPLRPPPPTAAAPPKLSDRGDEQLIAGNYLAAIDYYNEFLRANPGDPAAPRVRVTQQILGRLLQAESRIPELQRDVAAGRRDLQAARDEAARIQGELTAREHEVERLRASARHMEHVQRVQQLREDDLLQALNRLIATLAEAKRLKKDLETLKTIDIKLERRLHQ